jgi:hypothetical protein
MKMSILHRVSYFAVGLAFLIAPPRLPAPVVEPAETPVAQEHPSKTKRSPKPKSSSEQNEETEAKQTNKVAAKSTPPPRRKFVGNWVGTMPTIPWGNLESVVTIDSTETAMAVSWYNADDPGSGKIHQRFKPSPENERGHPALNPAFASARLEGGTLIASFPAPLLGTSTWSLTPEPDGVTAKARMQAFMNDFHAVFHRTADTSTSSSTATAAVVPSKSTAAPPVKTAEVPTAKAVPGKSGFVYNPFDSNKTHLLDVRGKASGAKVQDPVSKKFFIVP